MTTAVLEPLWYGKTWDQLSPEEWRLLRESNPSLWHRFIEASEPRNEPTVAPPAPNPAPSAADLDARIRQIVQSVVQTKEERRQELAGLVHGVGRVVREHVQEPHHKRLEALETANKRLEARNAAVEEEKAKLTTRLAALEDKISGFASASVVANEQMRIDSLQRQVAGFEDRQAGMNAKIDKETQTNSAQSRHIQAIEKKFGELAGRSRAT
jgi:hypothetical protein